mgnify:CR=1 FL=1
MDITTITEVLKQATPEMVGGLGSTTIVAAYNKIKSLFVKKEITEDTVKEKLNESEENRKLIEKFAMEIRNKNISSNDGKLIIGKNIWTGDFHNNTFNL